MKVLRQQIAYLLFALSSLFKGLGKAIITREKTIVVDVLTLQGWFVMDNCIIHQVMRNDEKLSGFEWHTYSMPGEWIDEMDRLKSKK